MKVRVITTIIIGKELLPSAICTHNKKVEDVFKKEVGPYVIVKTGNQSLLVQYCNGVNKGMLGES